jgi:hypothetical protein
MKQRQRRPGRGMPFRNSNSSAKPPVKVEDIKSGARVVVTAVEQKDKSMLAKTIEVGPGSTPAR